MKNLNEELKKITADAQRGLDIVNNTKQDTCGEIDYALLDEMKKNIDKLFSRKKKFESIDDVKATGRKVKFYSDEHEMHDSESYMHKDALELKHWRKSLEVEWSIKADIREAEKSGVENFGELEML